MLRPPRPHHRHRLDVAYLVRAPASPGDPRSPYFAVNRKSPPLNLIADDLSAAHRRNLGEHHDQHRPLSRLVPPTPLAGVPNAVEVVTEPPPAFCRRGTSTSRPRVRQVAPRQP